MDKQISYCTLFFNCFMIYCSPIMDRKNENNIDVWKKEETAAFEGWDFSHLKGRWENEQLPWGLQNHHQQISSAGNAAAGSWYRRRRIFIRAEGLIPRRLRRNEGD